MDLFFYVAVAVVLYVLIRRFGRGNVSDNGYNIEPAKQPDDWAHFQQQLEAKALPAVNIKLSGQPVSATFQSKFGGFAYWPDGMAYPKDKQGAEMVLLAQINLSDLPESVPDLPRSGLLQFFIANDDLYGMEFVDDKNTLQSYLQSPHNHAVIFHPQIDETVTTREVNVADKDMLPWDGESALSFQACQDLAHPADYRFEKVVGLLDEREDVLEYAYETLGEGGLHKMGGYAYFTQDDPRGYFGTDEDWQLLLQVDSDDNNDRFNIMWGDAGVANFFIRPDDLKRLDFSKVWYSWDCH